MGVNLPARPRVAGCLTLPAPCPAVSIPPSIRDAIVARLRPTHFGKHPRDVARAVVHELGLLGVRLPADDREVRVIADAVATGIPF